MPVAMNTAQTLATIEPPRVDIPDQESAPARFIKPDSLKNLGQRLNSLFMQYVSDRRILELRWLANQRQYLGLYDADVEALLSPNRSRAYPKVTRVKCISVVSRLMNLMFQGNEDNWDIKAAPWPDITPAEVTEALAAAKKKDQEAGTQAPIDIDYCLEAIQRYADSRAEKLKTLIRDQLEELGGAQAIDYVSLNREALMSGVLYGLGILWGPFARESESVTWSMGPDGSTPTPKKTRLYKPTFEFLPVWDFYPDISAKTLGAMDGFYIRRVLTRNQLKDLGDREDFFKDQIDLWLSRNEVGNYRPQSFEQELRVMGVKVNVNEMKPETMKYEIIIWNGPVSGAMLRDVGVVVDVEKITRDIDAEIWMIDGNVIKAVINPWRELNVDVPMIHTFLFDEDDTSPVGFGLPYAIRDSQMMISAATRMLLDNASVVCGPQLEINRDLLLADQDTANIGAYKVWARVGDGPEAQWPAVRNVQIDAHLDSLLKVIDLGLKFVDSETFVGPATGGDMSQAPSEPMRTAAGASMLRGDAALPFKDIVRSFDKFTMSLIHALVQFNRKLNPNFAPNGDYDVIARGATSLMAKELRGMQADSLVSTLTEDESNEIDARKLLSARLKARDMEDIMLTPDEAARRQQQRDQVSSAQQDQQNKLMEANIRKVLADAFKGVTQGQKNVAAADAQSVQAALDLMERGLNNAVALAAGQGAGAAADPAAQLGQPGGAGPSGASDGAAGAMQSPTGQVPVGGSPSPSGGGPVLN